MRLSPPAAPEDPMPRFRQPGRCPEDPAVRAVITEVMRPAHFFVGPTLSLACQPATRQTVVWEIFQGRLLDAPLTRQCHSFEAWDVFLCDAGGRSAEPLISVKLDEAAGQIHVVRALHCYAWEAYDAGDNVILSRETRKWVRELVGTIDLRRFPDAEGVRDELICRLFQAVVGTSRLPLTSVEAPLPAFSFGTLAYCYRPGCAATNPMTSPAELAELLRQPWLADVERAKLLETLLHNTPTEELGNLAVLASIPIGWPGRRYSDAPGQRPAGAEVLRRPGHPTPPLLDLLRTLFNEVSLSPWTDLVDKALALLRVLQEQERLAAADVVDFLGRLLRQLGRHLTAYDLVTFHHRGANYPDALLLDALLKAYLDLARRHPELFLDAADDTSARRQSKRLRRRGLRQGWLLRRRYEGHLVPEAPTSQGENRRVLPGAHARVPEGQILNPIRRNKRLFAEDSLQPHLDGKGQEILRQSLADLRDAEELRDLGTALFLDRPFGAGKPPAAPDATLLLSYEAFSRSLAGRRLQLLGGPLEALSPAAAEALRHTLEAAAAVHGVPLAAVATQTRPGTVALADAHQVAEDFIFRRTTPRTVRAFLDLYDFTDLRQRIDLDWLMPQRPVLILGGPADPAGRVRLAIHDDEARSRLELTFDATAGYESRGGVEFPADGLRVTGVRDARGELVMPRQDAVVRAS
jgi:hypothetical protein